jgi:hypothetical protein
MKSKDQIFLEQAYKNIVEGSPMDGSATRAAANPGIHHDDGSLLEDDDIQEALLYIQQYQQGDITNTQLALDLKKIFSKKDNPAHN